MKYVKLNKIKKTHILLIAFLTAIMIIIVNLSASLFKGQIKTLRIGFNDWAGYQLVLYGIEKGIFMKNGLNIELFDFDNLQDAGRATVRGNLDATFTTMWEIMQTDPRNDSPVVLMATDVSNGCDGIVTQEPIKSVSELVNKKVGVKLGGVPHLILLEALHLNKIPLKQVEIVDLTCKIAVKQMYQKKLDGIVTYEPFLSEMTSKLQGNLVYTTKDIGTSGINILASRSQFVAQHQKEFSQFILGWFEVMEALDTNPSEVFAAVAKLLGETPESFAENFACLKKGDMQMNQQMFAPGGNLSQAKAKIIKLLQEDLRHNRIIREDVQLENKPLMQAIKLWKKTQYIKG